MNCPHDRAPGFWCLKCNTVVRHRLEPVRDRPCWPNKNCRYARPGPGERCLDCGALEPGPPPAPTWVDRFLGSTSSSTNSPHCAHGVHPDSPIPCERCAPEAARSAVRALESNCPHGIGYARDPKTCPQCTPPTNCPHREVLLAGICADCGERLVPQNTQLLPEAPPPEEDAVGCLHRHVTGLGVCARCGVRIVDERDTTATDRGRAIELAWKTRELVHALATCKHPIARELVAHKLIVCPICGAFQQVRGAGQWATSHLRAAAIELDAEMNSDATTVQAPETDSGQKKRN